uniref:Uncharacterized protein n=2 Tax=Virgibacillus oceani TaxID=1479511 RepID=A0A917M077_9BACI|nr:hypothetical protein GCM10011398_09780 [Virgibacillus oceani]
MLIEVLPGIVPKLFEEIYERATIPVIAGGLVHTIQEVQYAIVGGAIAVTTSRSRAMVIYCTTIDNVFIMVYIIRTS